MRQGKHQSGKKVYPAARTRGDIQQGYTGDKVPGFDPAAAPLETDAEAAGTSLPTMAEHRTTTEGVRITDANSSSYDSAMRKFEGHKRPRYFVAGLIAAMLVLMLAVLFWLATDA